MFPYHGSKKVLAKRYPWPRHRLVIEPFAGSMGYTMHYRPAKAIGVELDERVVEIWDRLLEVNGNEPQPEVGSKTNDLLVKMLSYSRKASSAGEMTVTNRMVRDWRRLHRRWARLTPWVSKHVIVQHGNYWDAPDLEATWFIDPPPSEGRPSDYRHGSTEIDYERLAAWCQTRKGQVIVCEKEGADWLPFEPLPKLMARKVEESDETVWTNGCR